MFTLVSRSAIKTSKVSLAKGNQSAKKSSFDDRKWDYLNITVDNGIQSPERWNCAFSSAPLKAKIVLCIMSLSALVGIWSGFILLLNDMLSYKVHQELLA